MTCRSYTAKLAPVEQLLCQRAPSSGRFPEKFHCSTFLFVWIFKLRKTQTPSLLYQHTYCDAPKPRQGKLPLQHLASVHFCSVYACTISPSCDCIKHLPNNSAPQILKYENNALIVSIMNSLHVYIMIPVMSLFAMKSISCKCCKRGLSMNRLSSITVRTILQ